jgi:hypothetical protein
MNTHYVGCLDGLLKRKHGRQNVASLSDEYSSHVGYNRNHEG